MSQTVSIVVPTYNNAAYIERTMLSILAQTHRDLEIVVSDHASTDNTWDILQQYTSDPRVTLLQTAAGGGAVANWNRVSKAATSEYIKLVCGDDLIYPEIVEKQLRALQMTPSATLAASSRDIIDATDRPIVKARGLLDLDGHVLGKVAIRRTVVSGTNIFGEPGCVMMRREALARAGWWDSSFPYLIDEATYVRVLLDGDLVAIREALAAFRVSDSQWSVRLANFQREQAAGFHKSLFENHPGIISSWDLRRGNLAARLIASMRRLAYVVLRHRMRSAGS